MLHPRIGLEDGRSLGCTSVRDEQAHDNFFASLPTSLEQLRTCPARQLQMIKIIRTRLSRTTERMARWAISHRLHASMEMRRLLQQILEQPHGMALLPHDAAATRLEAADDVGRPFVGKICCCLRTNQRTGLRGWVHGSFVVLSSRKSMPIPNGLDASTPHAE